MPKTQKTPVGYSVRGVVVKAGGPAVVAAALGLTHQSVRNWSTIPAKHAETVANMAHLPLSVVRPELVAASTATIHVQRTGNRK
jgi:hypothetical protein